jgi:hypothetical protein
MYNMRRNQPKALSIKGEHTGIVIDNKDPDKLGRVKYRIQGMHDKIPDSDIPWTFPYNTGEPNSGKTGNVSVPQVGSAGVIKFSSDDMYDGRMVGTPTNKKSQVKELTGGKDTTGNDYPNVSSSIDASGNRITVNHKRKTVDFEHVSGTHITIDGKGHIGIKSASKGQGNNAQEKHSQGLTLQVFGDISFLGKNVTIGGDNVKILGKSEVFFGSKGNLKMAGKVMMPTPIISKFNSPDVPNVEEPPARESPALSPPADPTK